MFIVLHIEPEKIQHMIKEMSECSDYEVTKEAIEFWIRATVEQMVAEPAHYMGGHQTIMDTSVATFVPEPHCTYFGWVQCKNEPAPHSTLCQEHLEEYWEQLKRPYRKQRRAKWNKTEQEQFYSDN